jgi:hypothetical protein
MIPAFKLPGHTKLFKTKEWIILKNSKGKTHFKLYQLYFYAVSCAFEWNFVRKTAKIVAPKQRHNATVDSKTEEEISIAVKEGTKRKQRMKVKQKSKQTPQQAPVVAINWLLKHPWELGDFRNEL